MASPPSALPLHLLHLVALQSLAHEGFTSSSLAASHALTDVLARFITLLATTAGTHAEASGRTKLNLLDGVHALEELGLGVDELLEVGQDELDEDGELSLSADHDEARVVGPAAPKGRNGLDGLRRYLEEGLDLDPSDRQLYTFGTPTEEQLRSHLLQEEELLAFISDSEGEDAEDEPQVEPSEDEGVVADGSSSASASSDEDEPRRAPVVVKKEALALPPPPPPPPPPLPKPTLVPVLDFLEEDEPAGGEWLPFGRRMAHLPALPTAAAASSSLGGLAIPPSATPLTAGPDTPLGRASVPPPDALAVDESAPSFLRPIPFARSSLADAPLSLPSGPDAQTVHSAPTMAHSATLPALISAYLALNRAINADPTSSLAGGQSSANKNVKRLRAAYHLSFQSAPPEAYSPSPSLFSSLPVPAPRSTAVVPQVPPASSGVVLPPEVALARARPVVAGQPTLALAPGGAHRHPNMLANVLHYIAPPGILLRTSRMHEPKPLVDKGKELFYGPAYDAKGVIVTTTGGGIIRRRLPPKPTTNTHPKGRKGKKKARGSDEEFEALLDDAPADDDEPFGADGRRASLGGVGNAPIEWEEEEEELKIEVKEVDIDLRATWDHPVRGYRDDELPYERKKRRV